MNNAEVLIKFTGDASQVKNATKEVETELDDLAKEGAVAFAALTAAADAFAYSVLKGGIEYNAQMETFAVRLETLTGSAEEADAVMQQIKDDAIKTPFDVKSLVQAESLLLATGLSAEDAREDIMSLGNAVSASGGGNEELQRMAVNLQQIKNVGKASALDIKQFAYAGIDIYGLLADYMGISREEAAKLDVTYEMLSGALRKASSEGGKYYGAMEKQSKTYAGEISNLKESIAVMKGELAKGLFKALKKVIPYLQKFFDWVGKNHKVITAIAVPLLTFVNVFAALMIVKKVTTAMKGLWIVMSTNPVLAIIAAVAALVAGFIYLWNNCEDFRNFWIGLWNKIYGVFKPIIDGIVTAFKTTVDFIKAYWSFLYDYIVTPLINAWNTIKNVYSAIYGWIFDNVIKPVTNLFIGLWDKFTSGASGAWNGIKSIFSGFASFFTTIFTNAWNGILNLFKTGGNIFKTIVNGVLNGFKSIVNGLIDGINNVIAIPFNGINGVLSAIKNVNILGAKPFKGLINTISIPKIPHLNVGTNEVPQDMLAMIHKGEAVVPKKFNPYTNPSNSTLGMMNSPIKQTIIVNANFKQNALGQTVKDIKTFSGGAKNDYNYGM